MEPKIKILIITGIIAVIIGIIVFLVRQNKKNSPVDCVTNEWTDWSSCSVSCGGGSQSRSRTIKTAQKNGGKCDVILSETRSCNTQVCPVDCEVSSWSAFGPCINVNGVLKKTRTKTITKQASNGGTACPPASELKDEQVCPDRLLIIKDTLTSHPDIYPSVDGLWANKLYDNDENTFYNPAPKSRPERNMWVYFDITGASVTSLVYLTRFRIKFYLGEFLAGETLSNTISIYSDAGSITTDSNNIKNINLLPDKKIFEKQFNNSVSNIITFETNINPPVPVHKLLVYFSRRTFVYEIQFFGV